MSAEAIIGTFAALTALVGAIFTGMVSLRHARREIAAADVMELRAYRDAWLWAVRTIFRLLTLLGQSQIAEPEWVREELRTQQERIDNPSLVPTKEKA